MPGDRAPRKVGTCPHCRGSVLLRFEGGRREAACPCGATVIRHGFFQATLRKALAPEVVRRCR